MGYKRYVCIVIGGALCILLAVAFFTYKVDPANIFRNEELVKTCGTWLLQGHDVAITQNYDERLLQKYLIEHDVKNYDILVFGSSRTMGIGADLFEQQTVKNFSVSGASIEDDIALYCIYERLHGKPQKVIIGGDAWLLNANSGQNRWKSLAQEYEYGKEKMRKRSSFGKRVDIEKYTQLISWPYLNESMNKVKKDGVQDIAQGYALADDKTAVDKKAGIICVDGSHIYSADLHSKDADAMAREYIAGNVYSLEKYEEMDARIQADIKEFLSYLNAQGIEVVLYLTPYHPIVYSYLLQSDKYRNVMNAEAFFRNIAMEYGFTVVGSYDPEQCELSNEDFLDGMHMRREAVERILWGKL